MQHSPEETKHHTYGQRQILTGLDLYIKNGTKYRGVCGIRYKVLYRPQKQTMKMTIICCNEVSTAGEKISYQRRVHIYHIFVFIYVFNQS